MWQTPVAMISTSTSPGFGPPMSMVSIAFDAGEPGRWMLHCHQMPHLSTGMMTELIVSA